MKRLIVAAGMVLALVLMPGMMPKVVHADPSSGTYNFAVGGGTDSQAHHFAFSAHCQVAGPVPCDQTSATPPTGHVVIRGIFPGQPLSGPVTCLWVVGTHAYITFQDTISMQYLVFSVQDNGQPGNGLPDQVGEPFYNSVGPNSCGDTYDDIQTDSALMPLTSGNVVVNQGSILPCTPVSDNTTFMVNDSCNLYTNTGTATSPTWTLVQ